MVLSGDAARKLESGKFASSASSYKRAALVDKWDRKN
jgi:hypothetical protein